MAKSPVKWQKVTQSKKTVIFGQSEEGSKKLKVTQDFWRLRNQGKRINCLFIKN